MKLNTQQTFSGERAEYFSKDVQYDGAVCCDGESPLKHAKNISVNNGSFEWKYPLWNTNDARVSNSTFKEMSRSGLWYSENTRIDNTVIDAPKEFRRARGIYLTDVVFNNAAETMWSCSDIQLKNVTIKKGDYFAMNSSNFYAENLDLDGNYFLDGGKNIEIHNSRLLSKDAFWNCENVTVYDSYINGEYLGWNSKNLKFVNCTIESNQGLCYIDGLTLIDCTLNNTDLAFEYVSNINAEIKNKIISIKNPFSGIIKAEEIGTLIMNPKRVDVSKTEIICNKIGEKYTEDPNPNERIY